MVIHFESSTLQLCSSNIGFAFCKLDLVGIQSADEDYFWSSSGLVSSANFLMKVK